MNSRIGIRLEDKNQWERRAPLVPKHVRELREKHNIEVCVQASPIRAFSAQEYQQAGATVADDLAECPVILAVKEIPQELLDPGRTYVFFSHTVKGQKYNMPMLQRLLDLGCNLIDYEKIMDESGRRLVFFGNYAGLAGMLDTLWALGQRLAWEGIKTPLQQLLPARLYTDLGKARAAVQETGEKIARDGLPAAITPLICGFAGYGNVSRGAQEIFDLLPTREISPSDLLTSVPTEDKPTNVLYKVVFKEEDMVKALDPGASFDLQDYYDHPEKYRGVFKRYVPGLTVLVNGIYWTERYPRLLTRAYLRELFSQSQSPRLRVVGDISCDTEGAIECNLHSTTPGDPIYTYDPLTGKTQSGFAGRGVVVLAVDNLPAELPRESSTHFSETFMPFVPELARADYSLPFAQCDLSPSIKRAVIAWHGELTPDFRYIEEFLK